MKSLKDWPADTSALSHPARLREPSVYSHEETDQEALIATKYQLSLGVYHRIGRSLVRFAVTENLQNLNNTPDIGFQLGWAYGPQLGRR